MAVSLGTGEVGFSDGRPKLVTPVFLLHFSHYAAWYLPLGFDKSVRDMTTIFRDGIRTLIRQVNFFNFLLILLSHLGRPVLLVLEAPYYWE